jgi:hypothetical protein
MVWNKLRMAANTVRRASARLDYLRALAQSAERERRAAAARSADPNDLVLSGYCGYSQNDEDGIIDEIFRRIGVTCREFVEFGRGDGIEDNTLYLLCAGWRGVWLDGDGSSVAAALARRNLAGAQGRLAVREALVTAENINEVLLAAGVHPEPDLLSVGIDGNDYWVWAALDAVSSRVVVIEYNATFRPPHRIVQTYDPSRRWDGTSYFGASLKALEELGARKGYALVGTGDAGCNAFFVRGDLLRPGLFSEPFSAERHWRPACYAPSPSSLGVRHRPGVGPYEVLA